jgi:hypothetical protein
MMEAASISETPVTFHGTARCNIPEDSHLLCGRHLHLYISPEFSASDYFGIRATINKKSLEWETAPFIIHIARSSKYFKKE